jgi:hypothetical protein
MQLAIQAVTKASKDGSPQQNININHMTNTAPGATGLAAAAAPPSVADQI